MGTPGEWGKETVGLRFQAAGDHTPRARRSSREGEPKVVLGALAHRTVRI